VVFTTYFDQKEQIHLNYHPPTKKSPSLVLTNTAREQFKHHHLTKEMVLDIMKNRTDKIKLANGQFQFTGSDHNSNTYITVGFLPQKNQWVITNIHVIDPVFTIQAEPPPDPVVEPEQEDTSPPAIVFTNHAEEVLFKEFLDRRTIEHLIHHPDKQQNEDDEKVRFIGWADGDKIHVIAKFLLKEYKWLVITVEVRYQHDPNPSADIFEFDGEPTDEHSGVTFTKHALERMKLRNIYRYEVKQTILNPEKTFEQQDDKVKFVSKEFSLNRSYQVIARLLPEENTWLVISAWIRGEEDDGSLSTWQPQSQRQISASGLPRIVFTNRVRERMKREGMEGSHIEQAIIDPQARFTEKDGKVRFKGQSNKTGKDFYVISKFLAGENKWLVITAYYRSSFKPSYKSDHTSNGANISYVIIFILFIILVMVVALILYLSSLDTF
jgi:hypothetical protein